MEILVARHGRTLFNLERRIMGCRNDEPLIAEGIEQADVLAASLDEDVDVIVTSPLLRALQTAARVALRKKLHMRVLAELQERDSGSLSGKTWADIEVETNGKLSHAIVEKMGEIDFSPYGGQTIEDVRGQLRLAMQIIKIEYAGKKVLVVTHGGNIRVLYAMYKPGVKFQLHNASLHTFEI